MSAKPKTPKSNESLSTVAPPRTPEIDTGTDKRRSPRPAPKFGRAPLITLLLACAVAATYFPVLGHRLLNYDDPANVLINPYLNPLTWQNVFEVWRQPYSGVYVPVTNLFFAAETWLAQQSPVPRGMPLQVDPRIYHAGNLLLHIAATCSLFLLMRKLIGDALAAGIGALLFALHPLMAEPVAWVTETKCLLSGVFALLALWAYVQFVTRFLASLNHSSVTAPARHRTGKAHTARARRRGWLWLAAASLAYLLALLSKPTAAAIPLMAAILTIGWLVPEFPQTWRRAIVPLAPLAVWVLAALAAALFTKEQQPDLALDYVPDWGERPLVALDALGFYLRKLVLPVGLSPDYVHSARAVLDTGWRSWNWPIPVAVAVLMAAFRAPRPLWVAAGLFVAGLFPVLGFVPFGYQSISTVADRYIYLALVGPALAIAWGLMRIAVRGGANQLTATRVAYGAALTLAILFGVLAQRQCRIWSDDLTLASAGLAVCPDSAQLRSVRAGALENSGQLDEALVLYEQTVEVAPRSAMVRVGLAQAYQRRGREADALRVYGEAIELQHDFPGTHLALGTLLMKQGQIRQAAEHFEIARQLDHTSRLARRYLGDCQRQLGKPAAAVPLYREALEIRRTDAETWDQLAGTLADLKDTAAAIDAYRQACQSDPGEASYHNHLGSYLLGLGRPDEALPSFQAAVKLAPDNADNQHNAGVALLLIHRPADAVPHFAAEVRLRPADANAMFHLGTAYQRLANPQAALPWFRAAVERDPKSFAALVGLAGVATQLGDVDAAIAAYRQAVPLEPRNAQVHNALGVLLSRRGAPREAAEQFTAALEIDPNYAEARTNLEQLGAGNR
jgi:Tfp pilus assembly protein PilF